MGLFGVVVFLLGLFQLSALGALCTLASHETFLIFWGCPGNSGVSDSGLLLGVVSFLSLGPPVVLVYRFFFAGGFPY